MPSHLAPIYKLRYRGSECFLDWVILFFVLLFRVKEIDIIILSFLWERM